MMFATWLVVMVIATGFVLILLGLFCLIINEKLHIAWRVLAFVAIMLVATSPVMVGYKDPQSRTHKGDSK